MRTTCEHRASGKLFLEFTGKLLP